MLLSDLHSNFASLPYSLVMQPKLHNLCILSFLQYNEDATISLLGDFCEDPRKVSHAKHSATSGNRAGAHKTGVPFLRAFPAGFPLPGNSGCISAVLWGECAGKQRQLGHRGRDAGSLGLSIADMPDRCAHLPGLGPLTVPAGQLPILPGLLALPPVTASEKILR